ncbi:MBL fold metallo-hydrolase [Mycobacterium sp. CBMA293]|uniref:MBL fold metallo-hydrolase n=1 Tax=unclassified Mycolicibacterium TaxID=2636767 RepID=UPI0012DC805C|nr:MULTISPECIES: MBL fold metallo-hydrolase [unclassified Mycolicibacterium]MUL47188.1 MBL fold metallo-hydrolase [Mycolicibacterium sp. CBMA 360]MUL61297.1 MBL fold metallo-hydrolase [Mycolicibacterium sp. CBMA 335]MUL72032.1 MBL fold metallo-hydrolase [Mycolicibacterium sp. CBMA 311]MUL96199.1 MBL fold metallo-hydrolase [Mycolicibacterium sp. CBMA 230]MUM08977.1 Fe-S cluster assembly protein HesB [Mycolicibacterium sp. CBMA 213]
MTNEIPFEEGLFDLGGGAHVFLSGNEALGLANAGLVVSGGEALVIDTLYDVQHAQTMCAHMDELTQAAPVRYVFNTHTDGDHFFGNQVFSSDTEIITTEAASALMTQEHADLTAKLLGTETKPGGALQALEPLGRPFNFSEVRVRAADTTFNSEKALRVGKLDVELHELGPAHTVGDAIAYLPELGVLYAGDLLTRNIVAVTWSGSIPNWIKALERIRAFEAQTVVAGHGPVLAGPEVNAAIDRGIRFWSNLHTDASRLYDQGVPVAEAVARMDIRNYPEAMATLPIIVTAIYHERDPNIPYLDLTAAIESIAAQLTHHTHQ